jgi:hypothetical protein
MTAALSGEEGRDALDPSEEPEDADDVEDCWERRRPAFATAPAWKLLHSPTTAADPTFVDDRSVLGRRRARCPGSGQDALDPSRRGDVVRPGRATHEGSSVSTHSSLAHPASHHRDGADILHPQRV